MKRKKNKRKENKRPVWVKGLAAVVGILLLLLAAGCLLIHHYISKMNYGDAGAEETITEEELQKEEETEGSDSSAEEIDSLESRIQQNLQGEEEALYSDDVFNILLIGCDSRKKGGAGRSDSMILLSVNRKTEQITMTSIMRDIYVSIPGHNNNRINAAYAFGGANLLLDTIRDNFKIRVDKYAAADFYSFVDIIDILGGIELDVSSDEIKVMNKYIAELNRLNGRPADTYKLTAPGNQHVNGTQALAYARVRYVGNGDFQRTERQRTILMKVFEKLKNTSILKLNDVLNTVLPEISTNMQEKEIISLMLKLPSYLNYDVDTLRIPADGTYQSMRIRGMAVLGIDFERNIDLIEQTLYGLERQNKENDEQEKSGNVSQE